MRKNFFLFCMFLLFSILYFSCKKDEDINIPQIVIFSPNEFTNFNIKDTVNIKAKVTDDQNIATVEIVIVNTDFLPVSDRITLQPNSKEIDIQEAISIDDVHLKSGLYYLKIRASDGVNEKNLFRAINIDGIQRKFVSIISVNQVAENLFTIYSIDSTYKQLFSYSGNYNSSAINCDYQQFYICGQVNSNLNVYNLQDNTLVWTALPDNNPPFPSFENLYFEKDLLYVSCSKSYVSGYNRFQNINFKAYTISGYTPLKTLKLNNYLIVEEKQNTSNLRFLSIYFYPTGTLKNSTYLSSCVKSMYYKDNDEIYVFGNDINNNAMMSWFGIDNQTYYSPHLMPAGQLKDVVKIDNTNYLLLIGNKVFWYQENTNSLTVFIDNINAENIKFEDISQTIILSGGNLLTYYNFPSATKTGENVLPYSISEIHLLYNKNKE